MPDISSSLSKREVNARQNTYTKSEIDLKDGAIQAIAEAAQTTADAAEKKNQEHDQLIAELQEKTDGLQETPTTLWLNNFIDVQMPSCGGRAIAAATIRASRSMTASEPSTRQWAVLRIIDRDTGRLFWKADLDFSFGNGRTIGLTNVADVRKLGNRFALYAAHRYSYDAFCTVDVVVCDATEKGVSSPRLFFSLEYVMPYGEISLNTLDSSSLSSGNWLLLRCEDLSHKHNNMAILNQISAAFTTEDKEKLDDLENRYTKPAAGIPKSDLASGVQASLGKADTALQKHQDISGKLDKTGDASNTTVAFSAASARENVKTGEKLSVILGKIAKWFADLKTVAFTGSYNDLANKPTIPDISGKQDKLTAGANITISGNTISAKDTTYTSKSAVSGGTDVSLVTTGEKAIWNAKTSNVGTITGIKMNGASKGTSGVVDLGTVITVHQDISGKQDKSTAVTHTANTAIGSTTKPVYIAANGAATPISHSINADVPANAKFTDTTYSDATQSAHGLMTAADKKKLDGMDLSKYLPKDGTAKKAELLSSGQMRSAYCHNDDATFSNGYVWFKIGTAIASGGYGTVTTTFLGICGYGKHALYTARVRLTSAGNAVDSITFSESGRTGGMLTGLFRIVAINGEKNVTFELWAKGASRWEGTRVVILNEMRLDGSSQSNFWTLTSRGNADAKTAPTSGNMFVDSSDSSICATATNASNATTWHGLIDDTQTKNSADSWLLVKIGNKIQHRLSSELVVKEAATLTDSGWIATTRSTTFTATSTVKCRKYGQLVEVRGEVTFSDTCGSPTVCTLPAGYRPATVVQACGITPSGKQYMIKADTSGVISFGSDSGSTFVKGTTYRVDLTYLLG